MKNATLIFQTQIPAKLILFGEWAVLDGYPAVGIPLKKFFRLQVYGSPKLTLEAPEAKYEWSKAEAPPFLRLAKKAIEHFFPTPAKTLANYHFIFDRGWKLEEGLGSSSALFLTIMKFWEAQSGKNKSIFDIRKELISFQGGGSGFDLLIQAAAKPIVFQSPNIIQSFSTPLPRELLFFHTGKKEKTDVALKTVQRNPSLMKDIGDSTERFSQRVDWVRAIKEHHEALKSLGVVPNFVLKLEQDLLAKGWITALKTTGAGGGDTLMLWSETEYHKELVQHLYEQGFWLEDAL